MAIRSFGSNTWHWRIIMTVTVVGSSVMLNQIKNFFRNPFEKKPVSQVAYSTLTVLPGLSLLERITAGRYSWTNQDVTKKRFLHDQTTIGEWEWELVGYDRNISSEAVKVALEIDGWIAAKWEHTLAFGATFPEAQRKNPIVALGSACRVSGHRFVLLLWDGDGKRRVGLTRWDGRWRPNYRFLRVRKVSSSIA